MLYPTLHQKSSEKFLGVAVGSVGKTTSDFLCFQEKFLSEQQEVLAQCYEERRSLAAERAELSVLQKRALEREQRETQKSLQVRERWRRRRGREDVERERREERQRREEGEKWKKRRDILKA